MKQFILQKSVLLVFILISLTELNAQITIKDSDFSPFFKLGEKITTYLDRTTKQIDIGNKGQTTWDFSLLKASDQFITEIKDFASSPYSAKFPGAQYASNYQGTFEGTFSNTWVYNSLSTEFVSLGTGTVANGPTGEIKTTITFNPAMVEYKLPLNYGDKNTYTGTQTIQTSMTIPVLGNIDQTLIQDVTIVQEVDAYGIAIMPDGKKLNALRIKEERTLKTNGQISTDLTYTILTKTGESVAIVPKELNAISGSISISSISWTGGSGQTITEIKVEDPSGLTASTSDKSISLSWTDNSNNETGFSIERAETSTGIFSPIGTTGANLTTFNDNSATAGTQYSYKVLATGNGVKSGYSNQVNATIPVTVSNPSGLTASTSDKSISLSWTDNSNNETGFSIERAETSTGIFSPIGTTGTNVATFSDNSATAGTQYSYKVQASGNGVKSGYSNQVNATIPIPVVNINSPSNLISIIIDESVKLTWNDNSANEDGFVIMRSMDDINYEQLVKLPANQTSYIDASTEKNIRYYYHIYSFTGEVHSEFSNVVDIILTTNTYSLKPDKRQPDALMQNFPNPFTINTLINFTLQHKDNIILKIIDSNGKVVQMINQKNLSSGIHSINISGEKLRSGIYSYSLQTSVFTYSHKMILLK